MFIKIEGYKILIDDEDADRILARKWYTIWNRPNEIRFRSVSVTPEENKKIDFNYLTRFIMKIPPKGFARVRPIRKYDGVYYDYRKENLKVSWYKPKRPLLYDTIPKETRDAVDDCKKWGFIKPRPMGTPFVIPCDYKWGLWFTADNMTLHMYSHSKYLYGSMPIQSASELYRKTVAQCGVSVMEEKVEYITFTRVNVRNLSKIKNEKNICPQCYRTWLRFMADKGYIQEIRHGRPIPFPKEMPIEDVRDTLVKDEIAWYDL